MMGKAPFHISSLTMMLFGLSSLLDTGKCDDISIEDVKTHAIKGDLIPFLYQQADFKFDTGFAESEHEFASWYVSKLHDLCEVMDNRERRKYGIENRGLCLLISYTAELIQQGDDIRMEHIGAKK